MRKEFPGASAYYDRHGKRRWRFRRKGFSAELGSDYGSPEFVRRYEDAVAGIRSATGAGVGKTIPKSISDLIARYYSSAEFLELKESTKKTYRGILERFREEHGTKSAVNLERRHIKAILAAKSDTPSAANNLRDRLRAILDLAVDLEWRNDNPVAFVKPLKVRSKGFHTWTEEEIEKYYAVHRPGTLAHSAMTLMLYTGAARSDAVKLGRGNVHGDRLRYRRQKTEDSGGVLIDIPIHPELRAVIDTRSPAAFTFLETKAGKSRSPNGLGNLMREWCDEAKLPNCTSHGLRRAIARRLAEAGASPHEIMAVTGHHTLAEVMRYTQDVSRPALATNALTRLQ
ncbi:tyrosine-type recombinase/integrase [Sulfitobacter delicatus]|uniref:tyrosine-type recombinase/integrase n=1 Tax=Sulfitobacter delicatus TaxID=218672 RepID=UPI001428A470|nr:tyrosine-type recombinase/integrase [Sulfitobacter delicatus]